LGSCGSGARQYELCNRELSSCPFNWFLNKSRVPVQVFTKDIEHDALQQLLNVAQLPIVFGHVAAMPDVHHGTRTSTR